MTIKSRYGFEINVEYEYSDYIGITISDIHLSAFYSNECYKVFDDIDYVFHLFIASAMTRYLKYALSQMTYYEDVHVYGQEPDDPYSVTIRVKFPRISRNSMYEIETSVLARLTLLCIDDIYSFLRSYFEYDSTFRIISADKDKAVVTYLIFPRCTDPLRRRIDESISNGFRIIALNLPKTYSTIDPGYAIEDASDVLEQLNESIPKTQLLFSHRTNQYGAISASLGTKHGEVTDCETTVYLVTKSNSIHVDAIDSTLRRFIIQRL